MSASGISVYVMSTDAGHHKIGVSQDPTKRRTQLQGASGLKLRVVHQHQRPGRDAFLVEKMAHAILHEKRIQGEWFDVPESEAIAAVNAAIELVDAEDFSLIGGRFQSNLVGIRWADDEREALGLAAEADDRSISGMSRKIVVDWLRRGGWLKGGSRK